MNKKAIWVLALTAMFAAAHAHGHHFDREQDFRTVVSGNGVIIVEYLGRNSDVRIPLRIRGLPVVEIGDGAFMGRGLSSVTIPNGVISIGNWAFSGNQLANVTIGNRIASIGYAAFYNNRLTSIVIPNSVETIRDHAFNSNQLGNLIIPDSVTLIGLGAFANNRLTSVNIAGNKVISIRGFAFHNNKITTLTIGDGVSSLNESVFAGALRYISQISMGKNVNLHSSAPSDVVWAGFRSAYHASGHRPGIYTLHEGRWHFQARGSSKP
ncbi:MAG: leucine-rich repeat domain-containing protein [Treponema sp.]|nr:leucine-rich repeat domain-containing protein [Treponema sp.]